MRRGALFVRVLGLGSGGLVRNGALGVGLFGSRILRISGLLGGSLIRGLLGGSVSAALGSVRVLGIIGRLIGGDVGIGRSLLGSVLRAIGLLRRLVGSRLVRGGHDGKVALGGGDDGQLARRDLVLDRRLKRGSRRNTSRQAADRDRLDLARMDGLAGLSDDRGRVGILARQLNLFAGQHHVLAVLLGAVALGIKLVLGHASSLYLPTYYGPRARSRVLVLGRPLIHRFVRCRIQALQGAHPRPQHAHGRTSRRHAEGG